MVLVLDENLPRAFRRLLEGHTVLTVQEIGGAGLENGALLTHLTARCDVFVTADRNMRFQQRFAARPFGVLVLRARSTSIRDLAPLASAVLAALRISRPEMDERSARGHRQTPAPAARPRVSLNLTESCRCPFPDAIPTGNTRRDGVWFTPSERYAPLPRTRPLR
jgi:hypothetical protein